MENKSNSIGNYFDKFVKKQINERPNKGINDVITASQSIADEEERKLIELRKAIQEGVDSGINYDFDPVQHLKTLKLRRMDNGQL